MRYDTLILEPIRDTMVKVVDFIPTLLTALLILLVGGVIIHFIRKMLVHLLSVIEFDKVAGKLGITQFLRTGGIKDKPSEVIGCLAHCIMVIVLLFMTVKAFGLTIASGIIDKLLAYIPSVISGVVVLIIGMYLARFVSALVYIAAKNTDMPMPATLRKLSRLAIMVYVAIIFLKEIGFVALFHGAHYTIFIAGFVFALSLAFGLAGKDLASGYLEVFKSPTHK
ncbi:MAG: hypothetical protein KC733_01840 [Candidatus Omnitrophica bacterium]|nr:hypothetical protein [Candidatus Omnitrophota bacterium]